MPVIEAVPVTDGAYKNTRPKQSVQIRMAFGFCKFDSHRWWWGYKCFQLRSHYRHHHWHRWRVEIRDQQLKAITKLESLWRDSNLIDVGFYLLLFNCQWLGLDGAIGRLAIRAISAPEMEANASDRQDLIRSSVVSQPSQARQKLPKQIVRNIMAEELPS
jgi:hypothetical protein